MVGLLFLKEPGDLSLWPLQGEHLVAKRCEVCDKGPVAGRTVSHAHNVGLRRFEPNLQSVRAVINGGTRRIRVCTRCLRTGLIVKAARTSKVA